MPRSLRGLSCLSCIAFTALSNRKVCSAVPCRPVLQRDLLTLVSFTGEHFYSSRVGRSTASKDSVQLSMRYIYSL